MTSGFDVKLSFSRDQKGSVKLIIIHELLLHRKTTQYGFWVNFFTFDLYFKGILTEYFLL